MLPKGCIHALFLRWLQNKDITIPHPQSLPKPQQHSTFNVLCRNLLAGTIWQDAGSVSPSPGGVVPSRGSARDEGGRLSIIGWLPGIQKLKLRSPSPVSSPQPERFS